ncbi:Imm50 family immunity protein [Undibacterium sp. Dicai25W]|uniref:Imm50 family immunity protein n=1 Tax=Undibacterium sp. Dicai25W TaxID=3413034 RepID=UPI003BF16EFE
MNIETHIIGATDVIKILGFWPSFHDAEVISFGIERGITLGKNPVIAKLCVHVRKYDTVGAGTVEYAQVLSKSILINLAFANVADLDISDFNHQNVINSIDVTLLEAEDPREFSVFIDSIWGFGGRFKCSSIEIESVENILNVAS